MVSAVMSTAVSGLMASQTRIATSANNIANLHSTSTLKNGEYSLEPHHTQRVLQSAIEPSGGTKAIVQDKNPATTEVYDPDDAAANGDGITRYPNTSLEEELVNGSIIAKEDFKANLKVIKAEDEMLGSLLDIKA